MAVNTNLTLVVPTTEEQTVAPDMARRRPNAELRSREHLTLDEVERLIAAAKDGRHGHRDATMLLVAYRHGLRASELTDLRWDQIDFSTANLHVRRAKKGTPATHPILGDESRRHWPATSTSDHFRCSISPRRQPVNAISLIAQRPALFSPSTSALASVSPSAAY